MTRRVFIALPLSDEAKAIISESVAQLRWLQVRWLNPEHWHITVIPPISLEDKELELLIELLKRSRLGSVFSLRFSRIVLAPPGTAARMVWLEGETPKELPRLREKIESLWMLEPKLPPLKRDMRPLHLHVTLARFRPGDLRDIGGRSPVLGEAKIQCDASAIEIMESELLSTGAEYTTIATIAI